MIHAEEKPNTLQLLIEKKSLFGGFASAETLNFKTTGVDILPANTPEMRNRRILWLYEEEK